MSMSDNGKLKMVKFFVFIMTLIFVAGLGFLIYGVANRPGKAKTADIAAEPYNESVILQSAGDAQVKLMTGCGEMLCVDVSGRNTGENIIVIDPKTGKVQGRVNLILEKNPDSAKVAPTDSRKR